MEESDDIKSVSQALHWVVEHRKLAPCKRLRKEREVFFTELEQLERSRADLASRVRDLRQRVEHAETALGRAHADLVAGRVDEAALLEKVDACAAAFTAARVEVEAARDKPR